MKLDCLCFILFVATCSKSTLATQDEIAEKVCTNPEQCKSPTTTKSKAKKKKQKPGNLHPRDLPQPQLFESYSGNETVTLLDGTRQQLLHGAVNQVNYVKKTKQNAESSSDQQTKFYVLPSLIPRESIRSMLQLLRSYNDYDQDPDTVDGMPSYEMFIDSHDLGTEPRSSKWKDTDEASLQTRTPLRTKLKAITQPLLDDVITPLVRQQYPGICDNTKDGRGCTPCYSLIRRYRHGERQSHATHHDGHAIVTVVVSLSDYDIDYLGGLYVASGYGQRTFLPLKQGDAVFHRSFLLHGVQVHDLKHDPTKTERWSWILWYRDSQTCADHGVEWFRECSDAGDPICQELHASKLDDRTDVQEVIRLHTESAQKGSGDSAVKVARAYLLSESDAKSFANINPGHVMMARQYFQLAAEKAQHPDGYYGLAQLLLGETAAQEEATGVPPTTNDAKLQKALEYLEAGAELHHTYSMFNLGMAHVFGYGTSPNHALGAEWFVASGLPEGYYVASNFAAAIGNEKMQQEYLKRAQTLGFFTSWRQEAREKTGSGGATGVDLNLQWPTSPWRRGQKPPEV